MQFKLIGLGIPLVCTSQTYILINKYELSVTMNIRNLSAF